jgi:O-antigen chain-terminating methyltransferase
MLLSNNVDISVDMVSRKVDKICESRRRSTPLFFNPSPLVSLGGDPGSGLANLIILSKTSSQNIRAFIKKIPLIGLLAVNLNRRKKALLAPGLHWKVRLRLLPFIGGIAAWVYSIINLNKVRLDNEKRLNELRQLLEISRVDIKKIQIFIEQENTRLDRKFNESISVVQTNGQKLSEDFERFSMSTASKIVLIEQHAAQLARQWHLLDVALAVKPDKNDAIAEAQKDNPVETAQMAVFYSEFEDAFRGTREDISQRLKVYLPYFKCLSENEKFPVLDIGCGRGEWLGVLAECGIKAVGIDLNIAMVDTCKEFGFDVKCGDAINYLQQQPEGSIAAITGFHIIEHLSFEVLLALFDSALHALRPGGVIIFETPNPENILVGSCNFYYDPTHQHPVVPAVAEFIARQRGFASTEILRLHPYPDSHQFNDDSEIAKRLNALLYGPQDYAILAWKKNAD